MGSATDWDSLSKACEAGDLESCRILKEKRMAGFNEGGLLEDSSRTWKMESDYPEYQKGVADRLSKERVPEAEIESQFQYSPLQRGYAEGGEIGNFMDETGSMLAPEVPLNFEDEMPMGDEIMMGDEMMMEEEDTMGGLSPEDEEILFQALSDYPELEEILNKLGAVMSDSTDVFDEEGSVEGPGTGTSDSIPANLSDGEFVFTAKAVKQLGVDKLRKMMAKAEEDYNDGDAEQMIAQAGDEGFAAGGLLTRADYFAGGGEIRGIPIQQLDLFSGTFEGQDFSLGQIISMSRRKRFGKNFLERVSKIGTTGRYRVKGLAEGGSVDSDLYPSGVTDKEGYDKMINQHYDEWSPSDGIPGEGNPHIGEKAIMGKRQIRHRDAPEKVQFPEKEGLGTMLYKLLGLDPVKFTHPSKVPSGKKMIHRESSFLERV